MIMCIHYNVQVVSWVQTEHVGIRVMITIKYIDSDHLIFSEVRFSKIDKFGSMFDDKM